MYMKNITKWQRGYVAFFCLTLAFFATFSITNAEAKSLFKRFDGYWSGKGSILFSGGEKESLTCRATYFPSADGKTLKQNIRCASPSYKVSATSDYAYDKGNVTGTWRETGFELTGSVTGKAKGNSMELFVKGETFTADMSVTLKGCRQFIKIAPKGVQIDLMSLSFSNCK